MPQEMLDGHGACAGTKKQRTEILVNGKGNTLDNHLVSQHTSLQ